MSTATTSQVFSGGTGSSFNFTCPVGQYIVNPSVYRESEDSSPGPTGNTNDDVLRQIQVQCGNSINPPNSTQSFGKQWDTAESGADKSSSVEPITGVSVYYDGSNVNGLIFNYADGTEVKVGNTGDSEGSFTCPAGMAINGISGQGFNGSLYLGSINLSSNDTSIGQIQFTCGWQVDCVNTPAESLNPLCSEWAAANPSQYIGNISSVCTDQLIGSTSTTLGQTCRSVIVANPGKFDTIMVPYCATTTGATDPICGCINPEQPTVDSSISSALETEVQAILSEIAARPDCFNATCITHGYLSESLVNAQKTACPNISQTNCLEYSSTTVAGGSNVTGAISLVQSPECATYSTTNGSTSSPTNSSSSPTNSTSNGLSSSPTTSSTTSSTNYWLYIVIALAILLIVGGLIYWLSKRSTRNTKPNKQPTGQPKQQLNNQTNRNSGAIL